MGCGGAQTMGMWSCGTWCPGITGTPLPVPAVGVALRGGNTGGWGHVGWGWDLGTLGGVAMDYGVCGVRAALGRGGG